MTKRKHLKRRARDRAAKTGESYTAALRHLRHSAREGHMSTTTSTEFAASCSFCGKTNQQVRKLIAGPGVYICEECIALCNEIIDDELNGAELDGSRAPSLDDGPVERLVEIFGAMVRTTDSMEERLGAWARRLSQRGVPTATLAALSGTTEEEASERFNL